MQKLSDMQRQKLMEDIKGIFEIEQRVWGLLSPSSERDAARIHLKRARLSLEDIIIQD